MMSVAVHDRDQLDPNTFVGNWLRRESFAWSIRHRPDDAEAYGLFVLRHRDSGLVEQSNAALIRRALEPFDDGEDTGDAIILSCNHFAYSWTEEVAVRVYRRRTTCTTSAFDTLAGLVARMAADPILDEFDHSRREHEAALAGIRCALIGSGVDRDALPDGWELQVYTWLSANDERQLENWDDRGATPDPEAVIAALTALRLISPLEH
jgi:hypothetical protein